jgi:hypothetical protein
VVCGHVQPGSVASDGVTEKKVVTVITTTPTIAAATATSTVASGSRTAIVRQQNLDFGEGVRPRRLANSFLQTNGDSDRHNQSGGWHPILDVKSKDAESLNQQRNGSTSGRAEGKPRQIKRPRIGGNVTRYNNAALRGAFARHGCLPAIQI